MVKMDHSVWKDAKSVCEGEFESVGQFHTLISKLKYIPICTQLAEICQKMVKIAQSVWKFHQWISQHKNIPEDIKIMETGQKMVKIAQFVWKVCEEYVRVCKGEFDSVWKFHQWIFQVNYIPLHTQLAEIGQWRYI